MHGATMRKRGPQKQQLDIAQLHKPTPIERRKIEIVNRNWSRIFRMAELMTGHAAAGESITAGAFIEMKWRSDLSDRQNADRAFIQKIRKVMEFRPLSLRAVYAETRVEIRKTVKVEALKHVLPKLPATERLLFVLRHGVGYEVEYIAWLTDLCEDDVEAGSFLALLRVRELLAAEE